MMAFLTTRIGAWLSSIATVLAVVGGIFFAGRRSANKDNALREAEQARSQAKERAHADAQADRASDPVGELRRDWKR